jgi:hypothetical protein
MAQDQPEAGVVGSAVEVGRRLDVVPRLADRRGARVGARPQPGAPVAELDQAVGVAHTAREHLERGQRVEPALLDDPVVAGPGVVAEPVVVEVLVELVLDGGLELAAVERGE